MDGAHCVVAEAPPPCETDRGRIQDDNPNMLVYRRMEAGILSGLGSQQHNRLVATVSLSVELLETISWKQATARDTVQNLDTRN